MGNRRWTEEEDRLVCQAIAGTLTAADIALKIGRSKQCVYVRAYALRKEKKITKNLSTILWERKPIFKRKLTDLELAYLAGIIDGEGTITFVFNNAPNRPTKFLIRPMIAITNSDLGLMAWLEELFTVTTLSDNRYYKEGHQRLVKHITIHGMSRVVPLIDALLPYLRVKKRQAELLKEFCLKREVCRMGETYSDELLQIYWKVRKFNLSEKQLGLTVERMKQKGLTHLLEQLDAVNKSQEVEGVM